MKMSPATIRLELIIKVVGIGDAAGRKGVSFQLEKITP